MLKAAKLAKRIKTAILLGCPKGVIYSIEHEHRYHGYPYNCATLCDPSIVIADRFKDFHFQGCVRPSRFSRPLLWGGILK